MILQELVHYYDRKAQDPDSALAPEGFEQKEIPFVIVLDDDGALVQIEDTRSLVGKKKRARSFLVPQGVKKTSGVAANLLWDNAEYVLGVVTKGKPERVIEQHAAFKTRLAELPADDAGLIATTAFLANLPQDRLAKDPAWEEIVATNPNLTFQLLGDSELVCQRADVVAHLLAREADAAQETAQGICLVTGRPAEIERLHPSIKGVKDAQTSGANIVSFNQRSFESYGKEGKQGENAPVSKQAVFAYTTALNHLLGKDSAQRMQVGDASAVFWATADCELESGFASLWNEPPKDDPDRNTRAVKALFESVYQGNLNVSDEKTRFFVLGLAPNNARISVRFWQTGTVKDFLLRIARHFEDIDLVHSSELQQYLSLKTLLKSIAAREDEKNIPPNLGGDTLRAILAGLPYPETLLQSAVRRIRAEQDVNYPRAALIKACINRKSGKEELTVSLDENNTNVAYRLGRLFAVLERVQEEANPSIRATIRNTFWGAASGTPEKVFPMLINLSNKHLAKIRREKVGRATNLEKLIGSIVEAFDPDTPFPKNLLLNEQGSFAVGYYHQKQHPSTYKTQGE